MCPANDFRPHSKTCFIRPSYVSSIWLLIPPPFLKFTDTTANTTRLVHTHTLFSFSIRLKRYFTPKNWIISFIDFSCPHNKHQCSPVLFWTFISQTKNVKHQLLCSVEVEIHTELEKHFLYSFIKLGWIKRLCLSLCLSLSCSLFVQ